MRRRGAGPGSRRRSGGLPQLLANYRNGLLHALSSSAACALRHHHRCALQPLLLLLLWLLRRLLCRSLQLLLH
jgi:hypothetical protein